MSGVAGAPLRYAPATPTPQPSCHPWRIVVSSQPNLWYVRGEGNRPAGPFTSEG